MSVPESGVRRYTHSKKDGFTDNLHYLEVHFPRTVLGYFTRCVYKDGHTNGRYINQRDIEKMEGWVATGEWKIYVPAICPFVK